MARARTDPVAGTRIHDADRPEIRRLWQVGTAVIAYHCLVCGAASITALLLLDETRTNDLRRVGAVALLGGALGASARGVFDTASRLTEGFELFDGRIVEWRELRRARAREEWLRAHGGAPAPTASSRRRGGTDSEVERWEREHEIAQAEQELRSAELDAEWAQYRLFGLRLLPELIVLPVIGATLGLSAFAGVVGGFLVASGTGAPRYSPTGLLFIAFLAGLFAESFVDALRRAADALFGVQRHPDQRARSAGNGRQ